MLFRSNGGKSYNQRPIVAKGDQVDAGEIIADGSPVMQITQNLMDNDDPLGMRKLYIRKECCKLTGITYLP